MSTMNSIIKERRNALGLTQKELADRLSISDKTVSRWESGNQLPDAILLPDLAEALDISINELYGINSKKNQTIDEECSNNAPSKFAETINICYKIAMAAGLVLFIFGSMVLIHINTIRSIYPENGERTYGNMFTYLGLIICVGSQIAYSVLCRKKALNTPLHIKSEITYGGVCTFSTLAVFLIVFPVCITVPISYFYELAVATLVTAALVMMFLQKQNLRKEGIETNKIIDIASYSLATICLLIMLGVYIYLTFFEKIIHLDKLFEHFETISNEEHFEHLLILYSFYTISIPLLSSVVVNFVHLLMKSKSLKNR